MRIFKEVVLRLLVALLLIGSMLPILDTDKAAGDGGAIIADHTKVAEYANIPQYWIDQVKKMYLNVPGESHSLAYRRGLELLAHEDTRFAVNNTGDDEPPASDNQALIVNKWVYWEDPNDARFMNGSLLTGEQEWYTWRAHTTPPEPIASLIINHITHCHDDPSGIEISAIGFGWCWDMTWHNAPGGDNVTIDGVTFQWAGSSVDGPDGDRIWGLKEEDNLPTSNRVDMDDYLQATEDYINHIASLGDCNTKVFFTTGPVDHHASYSSTNNTENGYQREVKQQYIRDYVIANNKVLFDYADILTHNDDGEPWTNVYTDDLGVEHQYPQIHPDNTLNYSGSSSIGEWDNDHIGDVGALRLGKALWWMLARMAGWDGNVEHISITISGAAAAGIDFGSQSPGANEVLEAHSSDSLPSIIVTVDANTNVPVDLQIKGTDFITGFPVTSAKYSTSYGGAKTAMGTDYYTFSAAEWPDGVTSGSSVSLWHWLDVPSGITAGSYNSTFSYKAIVHE